MQYAYAAPPPAAPRRIWQPGFLLPLLALVVAFVVFSVPPYLSLDPRQSRVPPPSGFPMHFPLLVLHVVFGAVALLTACVQIWPWLRERRPDLHRLAGRVYVFAGVVPAALVSVPVALHSPFGPVVRASNLVLAAVWLAATVTGYRMGRSRRFAEHRRWMTRSVVLTLSIITNRLWAGVAYVTLAPQLSTTFAGSQQMLVWTIAGLSAWLGWVLPFVATEWWLGSREARPASAA
jgi:uncharacterized membrane protein